ncbi:MAG: hypothetical protein ACNA7O_11720 [Rhodobacterales bacterium]
MKPNFALTLSFDGIGLLHRAAAGWHMVGDVPLSSDDLSGALAVLRRTAIQLDSAGLRSKLVIPNEQIRYLNLPAPARGTDIAAHVAAMLDGATPYVVADLRYDWVVVGSDLHIAAVACETLDEAEAFAEEHGFAPVSFVAIPEADSFPGEPFFGLTAAAAHLINPADRLMRDTHAIRVLGSVKAPAPVDNAALAAAAPLARPDAETPAAPEKPATPDTATKANDDTAAPIESAAKAAEPTADETTAAAVEAAAQSVPGSGRPPLGILPVQSSAPAAEAEDDADADDASPEAASISPPAFASRRAPSVHEADGADSAADPVPASVSAQKPVTSGDAPDTTPAKNVDAVTAGGIPAPTAEKAPGTKDAAKAAAARDTLPPVSAAPSSPEQAPAAPAPTPAPSEKAPVLTPTAFRSAPPAPPALPSGTSGKSASGLAALTARLKGQPASADDAPAAEADIATVSPGVSPSEKERLTVFGARRPQAERLTDTRRSRLLVPALAASVVILLAGIAAWSSISRDTTSRGFFDSADATDETELVVLPPEDTTALLTQEEDVLTPVPPPAVLDIARLDHSDILGVIPEEDLTLSAPDADLAEEPQAAPELFEEPVALPETGVPDAATALASYAATGIWLVAPAQPDTPPAETLDELYIASIDTSLQNFDAVALPIARDTPVDTRPAAQSSPAAPGTSFDMDERGFVRATPEGAQTPDGAVVFAGRPPVTPEGMPTRFDRTPQPDAEPAAPLSLTRPQLRPDTLAESNERAQLGGMSLNELALLRPRARPETLAAVALALREADTTEVEADVEEADEADALDGGTAQAIAASLKPLARPSNFASLVQTRREAQQPPQQQQQQQQQQPQQQQVAAATLAPQRNAAPQIPSSASVAQQATVRGAINLRQVNLIGVYGQPSNRRALVRLSNGRYQKVQVGDRLDGGQVRAIGESELSYVKGNRSIVLSLPRG